MSGLHPRLFTPVQKSAQRPARSAVAPSALGIDLGGTKIETVVLTGDGELIRRQRIPDPGEYAAAIRTIAERAASTDATAGEACTIGIGTPRSLLPRSGGVRDGNSTYFNRRPLREDPIVALPHELRLANDANCLAVSEARNDAGAAAGSVFARVIATGVEDSIVPDGRISDIVLGGGMSEVGEPYPRRAEVIRHHASSNPWKGRIVPARWGDASGARGAVLGGQILTLFARPKKTRRRQRPVT